MRHTLSRLRSYFILDPLIMVGTAIFGATSLLSSFFDSDGRTQHNIARAWAKFVLMSALSHVEVIGLDKLDISKPYVYAANHLSAMDIPVLYASLPVQFRIVATIGIFKRP